MSGDGPFEGDPGGDTDSPAPPAGWTVWNDEPRGRRILVFRPDVFNEANDLPAPCLPTILVSNRSRAARPGASRVRTGTWHAVLTLEPEVEAVAEEYDSREAAVAGANDIATRFTAGEIDYRGAYQVPREAYLDRLDEVIGRDARGTVG